MYKIKIAILIIMIAGAGWLVRGNHHKDVVDRTAKKAVAAKAQAEAAVAKELASHCSANTASQTVVVSISQQHLWACEGTNEVYDAAVTTGAAIYPEDATLTGTWHIQGKQTDRYLTGSDSRGSWNEHVNYWIPYDGDYGFHDAPWQTFAFGDLNKYKTNGSHGCVRSSTANLKWLFDWAPIGTTVTINS